MEVGCESPYEQVTVMPIGSLKKRRDKSDTWIE